MRTIAVILIVLLTAAIPGWAQKADFPPQVDMRVPCAPTAGLVDGRTVLVYEVHLDNWQNDELTLERLEVVDAGGQRLATFDAATLEKMVKIAGHPDKKTVPPGGHAALFVWLSPDHISGALLHRLTVKTDKLHGACTGAVTPVLRAPVTALGPFSSRPGTWVAANGPSNDSVHRRAILVMNGGPHISQRFAIDWILSDAAGKSCHGDPAKNESYYCHGAPVLAVADGVVEATKDDVPENVPQQEPTYTLTPQNIGGNYVILRVGPNRWANYGHLIPHRVVVKPGQRVRRGQVIGYLGNSGNSSEPHLHLHVADHPVWLAAEGVPYVIAPYTVGGSPKVHRADLPGNGEQIHFLRK